MSRGRRSEEQVAKDIGARKPQPGSGAPWGFKGDVRLRGVVRVQDKETAKKSYSLKVDDWLEIEEQALRAGEVPTVTVNFYKQDVKLAVIDYRDWLMYVEWLKENQ